MDGAPFMCERDGGGRLSPQTHTSSPRSLGVGLQARGGALCVAVSTACPSLKAAPYHRG